LGVRLGDYPGRLPCGSHYPNLWDKVSFPSSALVAKGRRGQTLSGWPNKQKRKETEYMKEHTITLTINAHFNAIDREDAQRIAENMDIKFIHPDTKTEIENDLIDWEIR
jgi:hypothetical protein